MRNEFGADGRATRDTQHARAACLNAGAEARRSVKPGRSMPPASDVFDDDGQPSGGTQSTNVASSTAGPGQRGFDTQTMPARPADLSGPADQGRGESRNDGVGGTEPGSEDQSRVDTHATSVPDPALSQTIAEIVAAHRKRCFAMETRKRLDLALLSLLRTALGWSLALPADERDTIKARAVAIADGETDDPEAATWEGIVEAHNAGRQPFEAVEKAATHDMDRLARSLPAWPWFEANVFKSSAVSLAVIVGEAGDLSRYANPGKLWKRMGVALVGDVRQGGLAKSAPKAEWIAHGYSRQRRSRLWNIGDALVKKQGYLREVYLARKEYERVKAEARGLTVAPAAKIPAKRAAEFMSDGHVHRRAQRYMEKRLLRDLWSAWRAAGVATGEAVPSADPMFASMDLEAFDVRPVTRRAKGEGEAS
jgi:hypothetical protein